MKESNSQKNHLMKSSWNLGTTQTMRVPIAIKNRLMEIARHLDDGGTVELSHQRETALLEKNENILSQDSIDKIISILQLGIISKKQGGLYDSSNATSLKKEVLKALEILQKNENV
jgi:hypothetical protein